MLLALMSSDFMCCCLFEAREKKEDEILPLAFGDGGEVDWRRLGWPETEGAML